MLAIRDPIQQILDAVHSCTRQKLEKTEIAKIIVTARKIGFPRNGEVIKLKKKKYSLARSVLLSGGDRRAHILMTQHKKRKDHMVNQSGSQKIIKKRVSFGLRRFDQIEVGALAVIKKKSIKAKMKELGQLFSWKEIKNRTEREVLLLQQLQGNSSIIKIDFFFNNSKKRFYIGMELGEIDLLDFIETRNPSFKDGLLFARDCAKAVQVLHDREHPILHRDIKPENFLVMPNGRVKMIDLEFACEDRDILTRKLVSGSYGWLSPEVAKMATEKEKDISLVTPANDLFSLGLTISAIFIQKVLPFQDAQMDSPSKGFWRLANLTNEELREEFVFHKCPEVVQDLILNLLDIDPQKRMKAGQAVDELERLIKKEAEKSIPEGEEKKLY